MKIKQEAILLQLNFTTLERDMEIWLADWIENVREQYGEEQAEADKAELDANPWKALHWFVEDMAPAEPYVPMKLSGAVSST